MMDEYLKLDAENERMYALLCEAEKRLKEARSEMIAMDTYFEPERKIYLNNSEILDKLEKFFKDQAKENEDGENS